MVRLGMLGLLADWRSGDQDAFNARLDRLHYLVGALKRQGIYVYLGHLWWHTSTRVSEKDGFPGYGNGAPAFAFLYVNPKGREWYEKWVNALVNAKNPYTGLPMSHDPAVAVIEIQNESSLFFWTFRPQNLLPVEREALEKLFGDWAAKKYGSIERGAEDVGTGEAAASGGRQRRRRPPVPLRHRRPDRQRLGRRASATRSAPATNSSS